MSKADATGASADAPITGDVDVDRDGRAGSAADIRVLIVDDQALVRGGFRTIIDSEPGLSVAGEAADGEEAIAAVAELDPDVVCMDVQMPGMDGLDATRRLTASGARAAVLVLTTFNREDYLFAALEAGASGFLLKNSSPERLIEAVQVLARGDALLSPDVTRRVIEAAASRRTPGGRGAPGAAGRVSRTSDAVVPGLETRPSVSPRPPEGANPAATRPPERAAAAATRSPDAALTEREREVLVLLAEGLSNAEIARRIYVGEATVKTHVSNVLAKLALRDRVHAVVWAYEHRVVTPNS